jgi:hypothetical protein
MVVPCYSLVYSSQPALPETARRSGTRSPVRLPTDLAISHIFRGQLRAADETIEGKKAFEKHACLLDRGVKVLNYHADDGVFRANEWVKACRSKGQGLKHL